MEQSITLNIPALISYEEKEVILGVRNEGIMNTVYHKNHTHHSPDK